jgi:hypothetical protein
MRPTALRTRAVPVALGRVLHLVERGEDVEIGKFVQQLLHDLRTNFGRLVHRGNCVFTDAAGARAGHDAMVQG